MKRPRPSRARPRRKAGRRGSVLSSLSRPISRHASPTWPRGSTNEEERSSRDERNVVNTERTDTQKIGLTPRRVTVSVGVPSSYFEDVWRASEPAAGRSGAAAAGSQDGWRTSKHEEIERIQTAVVPLIPKPTDELDPTPLVTVTKFTSIAQPEIRRAWRGQRSHELVRRATGRRWDSSAWCSSSLLMVRSMVRAALPAASALDLPLPAALPGAG